MEIKEKELIGNLQKTRDKTNFLVKDLSINSMGLANTLQPRSPIKPKTRNHFLKINKDSGMKSLVPMAKDYEELLNKRMNEATIRQSSEDGGLTDPFSSIN